MFIVEHIIEKAYQRLGTKKGELLKRAAETTCNATYHMLWNRLSTIFNNQDTKLMPRVVEVVSIISVLIVASKIERLFSDIYDEVFSLSSIHIETPLISRLLRVKNGIEEAPFKCSAAYLLYGSPGTGKSFVADILAGSKTVQHIGIDQLKPKIRDKDVSRRFPSDDEVGVSIYLIDEIDKLIVGRPEVEALLHAFLDKIRNTSSIVIITTNDIDKVPAPIRRLGRLTETIHVPPWSKEEACEFCRSYDLPLSEAPVRDDGYYAGDMIEWARSTIIQRTLNKIG